MGLMTYYSETLTNVGLKYNQDSSNFVAGRVFPNCPVNLLSSTFPTYDKAYWMKNEAADRAPGTESKGSPHARGTDSYACKDKSFHDDVPDEYIANDPAPLNAEKAATNRVAKKIEIANEVDFATNFFSTSIWGTDKVPTTKWTAAGAGDPFGDIDTAKSTVKLATSFEPNTMVMSYEVYNVLKRHSDITGQIRYTSSANVTTDLLARMFEVDRVIVMSGVYDTAAYGATASQSFIGGKNVLLCYTASSPSLEEPSAGYRFTWNGYGQGGFGIKNWAIDALSARRVEAHSYADMKLVAADLGYFLSAVVA